MRLLLATGSILLLALPVYAQDEPAKKPELKTNKEKVSYAIGMNIGRQFKAQGMDIDPKVLAVGIAAILNDQEPALTPDEIKAAFDAMDAERTKAMQELAAKNKAEAVKFLKENATKKGVKKTKTGLQYLVLKEGTGKSPTLEDSVKAHYRGKLISGKVFDSSYEGKDPTSADKPFSTPVTRVIAGWTEALQLMPVGSKWQLTIPSELAYGQRGAGGAIGPNETLVFDVELLSIEKSASTE